MTQHDTATPQPILPAQPPKAPSRYGTRKEDSAEEATRGGVRGMDRLGVILEIRGN